MLNDNQISAQKQQERSRLQLQIDNRKRELDRLKLDLRNREVRQGEAKKKLDEANRLLFALNNQIKKQEGGIGYLHDESESHGDQISAHEVELKNLKTKKDNLLIEINKLKGDYDKLEQAYKSLEAGSKQVFGAKLNTDKSVKIKQVEIEKTRQEALIKKKINCRIGSWRKPNRRGDQPVRT